ncbi:uncharacterized protein QC761_122130 [Podospora bellae-mahoneyi]|uniref:SWIRM domain-containing protein n=1 Tax=Podospora bellae-mahoneyi TaxID=2093777 RepID=A0ABR0FVR9_9PEZI|nr:hypothetical protein QC761_122130 [Podospora bellae-mahoneyi]
MSMLGVCHPADGQTVMPNMADQLNSTNNSMHMPMSFGRIHPTARNPLSPPSQKPNLSTARSIMPNPSHLLSPPGPAPLDDMNSDMNITAQNSKGFEMQRPNPPPSPPVSPPSSPLSKSTASVMHRSVGPSDLILYETAERASAAPLPLFPPAPRTAGSVEDDLMNKHIAARPPSLFESVSPPKREDYQLVIYFKSEVYKRFSQNPRKWMEQERRLRQADRESARSVARARLPTILPASNPTPPRIHVPRAPVARVQKPRSPKVKAQAPRPIRATPAPTRPPTTGHVHATPEPRMRNAAPNREDKDFEALEDLSPPLDSLPQGRPNSLKVEWKGNALDLSNDPHRHLLHSDELILASNLRLDCATYLTSKRRIFLRRRECALIGKEFRKTDAQQACKIDVNKASKLWQAYDKVGWLNIEWTTARP